MNIGVAKFKPFVFIQENREDNNVTFWVPTTPANWHFWSLLFSQFGIFRPFPEFVTNEGEYVAKLLILTPEFLQSDNFSQFLEKFTNLRAGE